MASSSCGIHLCTDEVGLCALNLSVNEMLYQSISEKLLCVQVFTCRCLCTRKNTSDVCVCGEREAVYPRGRSDLVHFHLIYFQLTVSCWANQCPPRQPMSPAVPWEPGSVMNGSPVDTDAHIQTHTRTKKCRIQTCSSLPVGQAHHSRALWEVRRGG